MGSMKKEALIREIKRKIDDEINMCGEYYTGRRSAFEYVLNMLEPDNITENNTDAR